MTISRRTLAVGAAWSVPAVTVAAATPAYAVSPPRAVRVTGRASATGQSKYVDFTFTLSGPAPAGTSITITSISPDNGWSLPRTESIPTGATTVTVRVNRTTQTSGTFTVTGYTTSADGTRSSFTLTTVVS